MSEGEVHGLKDAETAKHDSLYSYGVDENDEKTLVEQEAQRLLDIVKNPQLPLILKGCQRLGKGDRKGYLAIYHLVAALVAVQDICNFDGLDSREAKKRSRQ